MAMNKSKKTKLPIAIFNKSKKKKSKKLDWTPPLPLPEPYWVPPTTLPEPEPIVMYSPNDKVTKRYDGSLYTKFPLKFLKVHIHNSSMPQWLKNKFHRIPYAEEFNGEKIIRRPKFIYVGDILFENYQNFMEFSDKSTKHFDGLSLKSTQILEEYLKERNMFLQWVQYKKAGYMEARLFEQDPVGDKIEKNIISFRKWRVKQPNFLFNYRHARTMSDIKPLKYTQLLDNIFPLKNNDT